MKNFIDRGHFVIEQLLLSKYCVTVSTGENYGYKDTRKVLNNLVIYSGGYLCDDILIKSPFNDVRAVRDELTNKCDKATRRLLRGMEKKKKYPLQTVLHFIVLNIGIKSFVKRKGSKYQGVIDKWKALGII